MKNNRELRYLLLNFGENIKTKFGRYKNAVRIACTLRRFELECTMTRSDSNSQGVNTGLADEFFNFFRLSVFCIFCGNIDIVFNTGQLSKLCLDNYAVCMSILDNLFSFFNVFFERIMRTIEHNRSKAVINTRLASSEVRTVIEMQRNGNIINFKSCFDKMYKITRICILSRTCGSLQNNRRFKFCRRARDALHDLHVVYVECANRESAVVSLLKHFFSSNQWHLALPPKIIRKNFSESTNSFFRQVYFNTLSN